MKDGDRLFLIPDVQQVRKEVTIVCSGTIATDIPLISGDEAIVEVLYWTTEYESERGTWILLMVDAEESVLIISMAGIQIPERQMTTASTPRSIMQIVLLHPNLVNLAHLSKMSSRSPKYGQLV